MGVLKLAACIGAALVACAVVTPPAMAGAPAQRLAPPPPPLKKNYATSWEEYQDYLKDAKGGTKKTFALLPDWSGVWTHAGGFALDPSLSRDKIPDMLTPKYKAEYLAKIDRVAKDVEWDPLSACLPAGYPRWVLEPFLREYILRPDTTFLVLEQEAEIRRVYTDGRGHVPDDEAYPLWEGDSIGFWDGDTLVVHTTNMKAGQYQRLEPDYSDKLSTVERIRKIDANTIEDLITLYDSDALVKPWRVRQVYSKVNDPPNLRINHWSCEENNNVVKTTSGASDFVLPGEKGYKNPNDLGAAAPK